MIQFINSKGEVVVRSPEIPTEEKVTEADLIRQAWTNTGIDKNFMSELINVNVFTLRKTICRLFFAAQMMSGVANGEDTILTWPIRRRIHR